MELYKTHKAAYESAKEAGFVDEAMNEFYLDSSNLFFRHRVKALDRIEHGK